MFTVKYTPQLCKPVTIPAKDETLERVIEPKFSGHVVMRVPTYDERCEMRDRVASADKAMLRISMRIASGEITKEQAADEILASGSSAGVSVTRAAVKMLPEYVKEIHISRVRDSYKYKSFDELLCDEGCNALIEELAGAIFAKVEIGPDGPELKQN